ncbi:small peptidoglycan-associated lipoprotein [Bacillus sp. 31A1R]|uniref:Small peptidoglycan-associated lipoprotein n=1 Tax=Robertmurraya mangrovi TaxID=3098077 RepID=A0ABU5ITZ6_9BACI|nr:small peptidoglycan-associated lipoprotein [Bacillus sp. 31A1R]MDZ5470627.1 small peptidoglycan-associated lipoprotein [Bacillus sp. 31A1R]
MKGLPIILLFSLLTITTSCSRTEEDEGLKIDNSIKQVIFFSNESEYEFEASYYDAIIELKKEFPEEIKNMIVLTPSKGKEHFDTFKVKDCPAIIVIYNEKIVVKVDGATSSDKIIKPIAKVLSKDS